MVMLANVMKVINDDKNKMHDISNNSSSKQ